MSATMSDAPSASWVSPAPMGAGRASPEPETCSQSLPADEKQDAQNAVLPFGWSHPYRSHAISPQKVTQASIPREKKHAYVQLNGKEFPVVCLPLPSVQGEKHLSTWIVSELPYFLLLLSKKGPFYLLS